MKQFCQIRTSWCARDLEDHRAHDLAAGLVAQRVDDPGVRVAPFATQ